MKKEIVYTDKYALILDIEKDIEENMFTLKDGKIREVSYLGQDNGNAIIAHLPLTDAPILEGVPLLPSFSWSQQDDVEELASNYIHANSSKWSNNTNEVGDNYGSFIEGYNKAKEKYKYTEDDMWEIFVRGIGVVKLEQKLSVKVVFDQYIQSLQQPSRPTHFEFENVYRVKSGTIQEHKEGKAGYEYYELKTTTNLQGHIELVGKDLNL